MRVIGHPVTGDTGQILYDCFTATDDAIDQRRLAYVGATDDRHDRQSGRIDTELLDLGLKIAKLLKSCRVGLINIYPLFVNHGVHPPA
ncbi:unannotated protein [freshwater metagenome]|uniref:Unannotated protein n=1 Tax=freshwater metagenome TaxID=449393 RepID=A0A6J7GUK9_9ZZZZ